MPQVFRGTVALTSYISRAGHWRHVKSGTRSKARDTSWEYLLYSLCGSYFEEVANLRHTLKANMGEKSGPRDGDPFEGQIPAHPRTRPRERKWKQFLLGLFTSSLIILSAYTYVNERFIKPELSKPQCPAQEVIGPKSHPEITERNVEKLFKSDAFKRLSAERLSGAVQIPTEDFDDMGPVDEDERWNVFNELEHYFKKTFPLLYV